MYCPSCGAPNNASSKFCVKCGKALSASAPQSTATPHRSAAPITSASKRTKLWIGAGIAIIIVLLVIALLASQTGTWKPSKPGVYLQANRAELRRERTMNPQQQGVPQTGDKQPKLQVYLPGEDTQYLQFMRVSSSKRDLGFDALAYDNGVYTIQPVSALSPGVYCVVLGGPLMMPTDVSWWCFAVTS